jgi:hypothetical protein
MKMYYLFIYCYYGCFYDFDYTKQQKDSWAYKAFFVKIKEYAQSTSTIFQKHKTNKDKKNQKYGEKMLNIVIINLMLKEQLIKCSQPNLFYFLLG